MCIATGTIDVIQNFGDEFSSGAINLEPTKDAKGCICKVFSYTAQIKPTKKKDLPNRSVHALRIDDLEREVA